MKTTESVKQTASALFTNRFRVRKVFKDDWFNKEYNFISLN